jgi:hypothetical protein
VSVQTVLSKFNDYPENLFKFATVITEWGVKNWIIHVTVLAGKAAVVERKYRAAPGEQRISPKENGLPTLRRLLALLDEANLPLDLRVTNANPVRYSVFLVGSKGDLFTEGLAKLGKKLVYCAEDIDPLIDIWKDVDEKAHTGRYANWIGDLFTDKNLSDLALDL